MHLLQAIKEAESTEDQAFLLALYVGKTLGANWHFEPVELTPTQRASKAIQLGCIEERVKTRKPKEQPEDLDIPEHLTVDHKFIDGFPMSYRSDAADDENKRPRARFMEYNWHNCH